MKVSAALPTIENVQSATFRALCLAMADMGEALRRAQKTGDLDATTYRVLDRLKATFAAHQAATTMAS